MPATIPAANPALRKTPVPETVPLPTVRKSTPRARRATRCENGTDPARYAAPRTAGPGSAVRFPRSVPITTTDLYIRPNPSKARDMPDSAGALPATVQGMPVDPGTDVERVLVVTAHPDDVDFGAAGSIATWTTAGLEVAYCIVTDGDAGGYDLSVPRADIAGIRQAEQRAAAKVVGVEDLTFLGHPDGGVEVTLDLRRDISRVIRRFRPDRVVTQSPDRNWQRIFASHPDHLAAGEAALCAVYPDARNPFAFPELLDEGLDAWTVREVWLMSMQDPDRFVDITDVFDRKLAALREHASQMPGVEDLEGMLRGWLSINAVAAGLPEGRLAESFRAVVTG